MPMKRRFEIIPIVESEIVPDQSLELIKGGGYITTCSEGYSCETYVNGHCSLNTCQKDMFLERFNGKKIQFYPGILRKCGDCEDSAFMTTADIARFNKWLRDNGKNIQCIRTG